MFKPTIHYMHPPAGMTEAGYFDDGLVEDHNLSEGLGGHTYTDFKQFVTEAVNLEFHERAE